MLKILLLKRKRDNLTAVLKKRKAENNFEKREKELKEAIEEVTEETPQEDVDEVQKSIDELEKEKAEYEEELKKLEKEIASIDDEIKKLEAEQPKPEEEPQPAGDESDPDPKPENRGEARSRAGGGMRKRFKNLPLHERKAVVERSKNFLEELKNMALNRRSVTGAGLTIPTEFVDFIKAEMDAAGYSKLMQFVRVKKVRGDGFANVLAEAPLAVWTEQGGVINEINLNIAKVSLGGYKVAAFVPIDEYELEDSAIDLAAELINSLAESLGKAIDMAILYGTGQTGKMPLGIVTNINNATTTLKTTQVVTIANTVTGDDLIADLIEASGKCKHGNGPLFWAMNHKTLTKIKAESLGRNASGAYVAAGDEMPVIGGKFVEIEGMPDNNIVGGFGQRYVLGERAEMKLKRSDEVRFLEDEVVFKATARYDGTPAIGDAFVVIGIAGTAPTMTYTFAADTANTPPAKDEE